MITCPASTDGGNSTVRLAVVLEDPALLILNKKIFLKISRLYLPVARNAAELPGVPLVRAADTEGTHDILSFLRFLEKS